jgi:hypothetical protein
MRRRSAGPFRRALLGGAVLIIALGATPARAGALVKTFDRSDNDFSFTYSHDGRIRAAFSSTVFKRSDKVSFFAYVRERPAGAPEGKRLAGVLELTLATARPVRYDGRFALIVRNVGGPDAGSTAVRRTTTRSFTLRPGDRREVIRFRFDVERGRYVAFARFMELDD